jgi:hypothetical protein
VDPAGLRRRPEGDWRRPQTIQGGGLRPTAATGETSVDEWCNESRPTQDVYSPCNTDPGLRLIMAETGRPLIPREVLPAPVPAAAKVARRPPVTPADAGRQLSIFGAETTEASPSDLAALLAGPGRLDRMGGTARVSVRVDAAWRVHVLVAELVSRGLVVNWRRLDQDPEQGVRHGESPEDREVPPHAAADPANPDPDPEVQIDELAPDELSPDEMAPDELTPDGLSPADPSAQERDVTPESHVTSAPGATEAAETGAEHAGQQPDAPTARAGSAMFEVRTAYSSRLKPLAHAWPRAADQLFLSGPRLRLWVAAAGRPTDGGYALGLDPGYGPGTPEAAGAALRRAGLEAVLSDHGRDYLIMGRRRLARLAELVGERPAAAPEAFWPGGSAA